MCVPRLRRWFSTTHTPDICVACLRPSVSFHRFSPLDRHISVDVLGNPPLDCEMRWSDELNLGVRRSGGHLFMREDLLQINQSKVFASHSFQPDNLNSQKHRIQANPFAAFKSFGSCSRLMNAVWIHFLTSVKNIEAVGLEPWRGPGCFSKPFFCSVHSTGLQVFLAPRERGKLARSLNLNGSADVAVSLCCAQAWPWHLRHCAGGHYRHGLSRWVKRSRLRCLGRHNLVFGSKKLLGLLGAPGVTTRSKKLLGAGD